VLCAKLSVNVVLNIPYAIIVFAHTKELINKFYVNERFGERSFTYSHAGNYVE
jgi:hypothetical protein